MSAQNPYTEGEKAAKRWAEALDEATPEDMIRMIRALHDEADGLQPKVQAAHAEWTGLATRLERAGQRIAALKQRLADEL